MYLSVKCNVAIFQSYLAVHLVREASNIVITKCPVVKSSKGVDNLTIEGRQASV